MRLAPPRVVPLSSPLNRPCVWPLTFMVMRTPTAALACVMAPLRGLASCQATLATRIAASATASATTTVRVRERTDAAVMGSDLLLLAPELTGRGNCRGLAAKFSLLTLALWRRSCGAGRRGSRASGRGHRPGGRRTGLGHVAEV